MPNYDWAVTHNSSETPKGAVMVRKLLSLISLATLALLTLANPAFAGGSGGSFQVITGDTQVFNWSLLWWILIALDIVIGVLLIIKAKTARDLIIAILLVVLAIGIVTAASANGEITHLYHRTNSGVAVDAGNACAKLGYQPGTAESSYCIAGYFSGKGRPLQPVG